MPIGNLHDCLGQIRLQKRALAGFLLGLNFSPVRAVIDCRWTQFRMIGQRGRGPRSAKLLPLFTQVVAPSGKTLGNEQDRSDSHVIDRLTDACLAQLFLKSSVPSKRSQSMTSKLSVLLMMVHRTAMCWSCVGIWLTAHRTWENM